MLNLTKRINKLVEKTNSIESKNACQQVLEMWKGTTVPEENISNLLIEKLKEVKDGDKYVASFIQTTQKYLDIRDLGITKAISAVRESQTYHYPALKYALDRFERSKINEGTYDFLVVEEFMSSLKDFTWDSNVKTTLEEIVEKFENNKECILVSKALYELKRTKGNFIFDKICEQLDDHFESPTDASRTALIESLSTFTFNNTVKSLMENLKKIKSSKTGGLQIIAENGNCNVNPVYSTILLENNKEFFTIKGDVYKKEGSLVEKVTRDEFQSLSESIKRSYEILNLSNFFVKEGKASFYLGKNKIEISESENATRVLFNDKQIPKEDIAKNLVMTGMIRLEEAKVASDIQFISDIFEKFYELDFAKVISSKLYEGSYVTLMKIDDKIYLNKVNESMRSNEFFTDLNATQARNIVLEFLGYDIKESMQEFLNREEAEINSLKEEQTRILADMSILEGEINKLETAKKDQYLATKSQILELETILSNELVSLKSDYANVSSQLKKFESKISDSGIEIGQDVKMKSNNEVATVTSINSNTKKATVITSDGKTKEINIADIVSLKEEEEKGFDDNERKAAEEKKKEEEEAPIEEATTNLNAGSNDLPVENPNKDDFPSQEPTPVPASVKDENPEYVPGSITTEQGGSCAGKEVQVLASDFAAKGPEDLIQVKCEDELYFIEKKYIQMATDESDDSLTIDFDEKAPGDDTKEEPKEEETKEEESKEEKEEPKEEENEEKKDPAASLEKLHSKLAKALKELESIKAEMKDTASTNESLSLTIKGLQELAEAMESKA